MRLEVVVPRDVQRRLQRTPGKISQYRGHLVDEESLGQIARRQPQQQAAVLDPQCVHRVVRIDRSGQARRHVVRRRVRARQRRISQVVPVPRVYAQVPAERLARPEHGDEPAAEVRVNVEGARERGEVVAVLVERLGHPEQTGQREVGIRRLRERGDNLVAGHRTADVQFVEPIQHPSGPLRIREPRPRQPTCTRNPPRLRHTRQPSGTTGPSSPPVSRPLPRTHSP